MQKTVSTEQMALNIAKIIDLLADVPNKLESLSRYLSKGSTEQPLGPGERSIVEVLAHLINCSPIFRGHLPCLASRRTCIHRYPP
jgi:hypothetical protein